ncbi:MAG: hypothetical protein M1828_002714 [Chrysothrix sp. TS-e1954]|nr:MAG: hypothetical protein M1828_002714 [Chrysothrix sp. TS-e1954]
MPSFIQALRTLTLSSFLVVLVSSLFLFPSSVEGRRNKDIVGTALGSGTSFICPPCGAIASSVFGTRAHHDNERGILDTHNGNVAAFKLFAYLVDHHEDALDDNSPNAYLVAHRGMALATIEADEAQKAALRGITRDAFADEDVGRIRTKYLSDYYSNKTMPHPDMAQAELQLSKAMTELMHATEGAPNMPVRIKMKYMSDSDMEKAVVPYLDDEQEENITAYLEETLIFY